MADLNVALPKPLKQALRRYARDHGITLSTAVIQAVKQITAEPSTNRIETIAARLSQLEARVDALSGAPPSTEEDLDREIHDQADLFLMDAEEQDRRSQAYQHWLNHFTLHPEELEPGRSAHEMAALKASVV